MAYQIIDLLHFFIHQMSCIEFSLQPPISFVFILCYWLSTFLFFLDSFLDSALSLSLMERIIFSKTRLPKLSLLSSRHGQRFTGVNHLRCSLFPKQESSNLLLSSSSSLFPTASRCSAHDFSDLVNEVTSEKRHRSSQLGFCKDASRSQSFLKVRLLCL